MKKLIAGLVVLALAVARLSAGQATDQKHIEKIKKRVSHCVEKARHVCVETYDGRRLQGSVSEAGPDSFVLNFQTKSTTLNYADVKSIRWPSVGSNVARTVVIAAAVTGALVLGVVLLGGLKD